MKLIIVVFGMVVIAVAVMSAAQAPAPKPKFEVVSIKPNNSGSQSWSGDFGAYMTATNITPRDLILRSYDLFDSQLVGGPEWLRTARFDIQARAQSGTNPRGQEVLILIQSLLEDQFQLKLQHAIRELPVFDLVVAKGQK